MPLPTDLRTILLLGIFVLMAFYTLYVTREVLIPILFAFILNLLLQPAMRTLTRWRLPRTIAALLMILVFFGVSGGIGASISSSAADWIAKAPESLTLLEQRLSFLKEPLGQLQDATKRVEDMTQGDQATVAVAVDNGQGLSSLLLLNTQSFLIGLGVTVVLLFFLLVTGDMFLRRFVEILPKMSNKKQLVEISQEIERNISGYLFTITLMNAAVGILTGLAAYLFGMSDPILWGVAAMLLNYLPILGPLLGTGMLFLAGLVTFDTIWQALLPAAAYLAIHIIEETITPMLLARRFILNPVLVIISIVFLVLDVGCRRGAVGGPVARGAEDHLRSYSAIGGIRTFPRHRGPQLSGRRNGPGSSPRHSTASRCLTAITKLSAATAGIVWEAMKGVLRNDGFELSGYIAFNALLALFPFLIFLFALSGLVSSYDTAGMVLEFLFRLAPKNVGDTLAPVIVEVLSRPRGGLLTIGLLFAIWAASSGVDALRLSLNRAYSITEERSIWRLKLQSILFVLVGGSFIFVAALVILLGPILWHVARSLFSLSTNDEQTWILGRYALGAVLICFTTGMLHLFLPMKRQGC